jgi:hypothetical protein
VFVTWEPVIETDWSRPDASITSTIPDARATHYWDGDRRLSAEYGGAANAEKLASSTKIGFAMRGVIWDAALVYPAGVRWGERARLLAAPVYKHAGALLAE